MIRYNDPSQQVIPGFEKFHGFPLDMNNRWVKLSERIPWDEFAKAYDKEYEFREGPTLQTGAAGYWRRHH
ncbi:MAG: hypothetical protein JXO49_07960 [Deltaproteobacteria bacterium]|nr:hypothetical protein [Candidatus Anaeroferrophillus wilburensis]MBN2889263.1 hypothetical protein [Deltaproteobacteria bacterium]